MTDLGLSLKDIRGKPSRPFVSLRLLGIRLARLAEHAERRAALLTVAFLVPVRRVATTGTAAATTRLAEEQHVGNRDRHLLGEPTALGVASIGLQVLVHPIDP